MKPLLKNLCHSGVKFQQFWPVFQTFFPSLLQNKKLHMITCCTLWHGVCFSGFTAFIRHELVAECTQRQMLHVASGNELIQVSGNSLKPPLIIIKKAMPAVCMTVVPVQYEVVKRRMWHIGVDTSFLFVLLGLPCSGLVAKVTRPSLHTLLETPCYLFRTYSGSQGSGKCRQWGGSPQLRETKP